MENNYFVYTKTDDSIKIERFHICTWEFQDSSLIEFGAEIDKESVENKDCLEVYLYLPWISKECEFEDFYYKLNNADNSRFIFNDSIKGTEYLKQNTNGSGVIHKFSGKGELCILPVETKISEDCIVKAKLNLKPYKEFNGIKPNIYFRFSVKPNFSHISTHKKGINKTRIIYDIKVNEKRNIPENKVSHFQDTQFCNIKTCFSFNIVPNKFDLEFFESSSLKSVRALEFESFKKYLGDKRVKKDDLVVVFNKKQKAESFSFFSMYAVERIGIGQFALAILINIICGFLLFLPSFRDNLDSNLTLKEKFKSLPVEIYIVLLLLIIATIYFVFPWFVKCTNWFYSKINKKQ